MTGINEVAKEIHENAVAHGWWDEERGFPEVLALIHSEVSEALEEYDDLRNQIERKGGILLGRESAGEKEASEEVTEV